MLGDVGFLSGHFRKFLVAGDKLNSAKTEAAEFFRNFCLILNPVVSSKEVVFFYLLSTGLMLKG